MSLIAKGQVSIYKQEDSYSIVQSVSNYLFPADSNGVISNSISFTSSIKVTQGEKNLTDFTIGTISKPTGFNSILVNNDNKSITYNVAANTTTLAINGSIIIPVIIGSQTYNLSFSYARVNAGKQGDKGNPGVDANLLDWVQDWNTNKTILGSESIITPKIFAGTKNANNTISGIALGKFPLSTVNDSGTVISETINGIYGFNNGKKTFSIDISGNVQLGNSNQFIKYNSSTGKIEFGSEVSLNWTNAISVAKTDAISIAASDATAKINNLKPEIYQSSSQKIRYIRDWLNGSNVNTGNHWVEIKAFDYSGTNIALNKTVSGCTTSKVIVNDDVNTANYASGTSGLQLVTIDLGAAYDIKYIQVWHYYSDSRTYNETKTEVSLDGTNWLTLFDSAWEGKYKESSSGRTYYIKQYEREFFLKQSINDAWTCGVYAEEVAVAISEKANEQKWATKLTYIDQSGIFTGVLSANTVNAININAVQITAGTIDAARINVEAIKSSLITAANINALTLTVNKGTIGGWSIDGDSIFRGTKNNTSGAFTSASGSVTIGSNGIRGFKWRLDSTGAGSVAGGNISWDANGAVSFTDSVKLNWTSYADSKVADIRVGGRNLFRNTNVGVGNWSQTIQSGTTTRSAVTALGENGCQYTITTPSTGYHVITHSNLMRDKIVAGKAYSISFDVFSSFDTTIGIAIMTSSALYRLLTFTNLTIKKDVWRRYTGTAIATSETGTGQLLYITGFNFVGTVTFANLMLVEGNQPSAWSSSTEDLTDGISAAQTAANNATTALGGTSFPKLTQISSTGIYTGTLTASQITAGTISVDRLAAGSITAEKLNVTNVQASIVTASVINGLTCAFTKGTIGGWSIDSTSIYSSNLVISNGSKRIAVFGADSGISSGTRTMLYWNSNTDWGFFTSNSSGTSIAQFGSTNQIASWIIDTDSISRGTKNNTSEAFTATTVSITIGSNGIRGFKWRLDATGAGAVAGGNISWDASGNVTFGSSVSLNWTTGINNLTTALGGTSYTKLTKIDSTGIYTGTITATQITAGIISTDRLDAATIKANIINVAYINGLTCTFDKGKIGGWTIGGDNISIGSIGTVGATPIQLRSASTGSGYIYSGAYKPYGLTMSWHQSSNAGHFVFGQVLASGNTVKTGFIGIQMMAWDNTEYFCLSANSTLSGSKEVYNRIAGWAFDSTKIWKNNVSLGADGSIANGTLWKLNNDGSGQLANGNISWNASGTVTFASSVSLNWTNAANSALTTAQAYADTKKTEAINTAATDATTKTNAAKELAQAMAFGRMIYRDPIFYNGNNGVAIYNNSNNGTVTVTRTSDTTAPNDSKQVLVINNTGTSSPYCGGFYWGTTTSYRKVFITRIIAKIPVGRNITFHSNTIGTGGYHKWLTDVAGTGDWCEYIYKVVCGTASFAATHYFAIDGNIGTIDNPVEWRVAYATVFDNTSTEKYTTTIDSNGIYTGTLTASQITAGTISVDRLDATAIKSNIINTAYLQGLSLNFTQGIIGGWTISASQISKNSVILGSDGTISNSTKWKLGYDGSGYVANGNVSWTTLGAVSVTGTINATSGYIGGFKIEGNKLTNNAGDSSIYFDNLNGASYVRINESSGSLVSLRADSAKTALGIQTYASGAIGIHIIANAGSTHAIESYGPHQFGQRSGEKWNAPGVLFSGLLKNSTTIYNSWGNGLTVTSVSKLQTGEYILYHNLGHTQYTVVANTYYESGLSQHMNCFVRIEYITSSSVRLRVVNADNGGLVETSFTFAIIGRNKW